MAHWLPAGGRLRFSHVTDLYTLFARRNINDVCAFAGPFTRHRHVQAGPKRTNRGTPRPEGVNEDIELFSIDGGWNEQALAQAGAVELLDELEGWSVEALMDDADEDEDVDFEDGDIDELAEAAYQSGADEEIKSDKDFMAPGVKGVKKGGKKSVARLTGEAERDLLASLPVHMVRRLAAAQAEAEAERVRLSPASQRQAAARQKTHCRLKIIAGSAAGVRILSPQGDQTRPMMELVRGAVFSMLSSLHGSPGALPGNTRWLDLFAGTGAVGIEALSRGAGEAHFVELSPWVINNCLHPNLERCGVDGDAVVHTGRVEDFLRRAAGTPRFAGGPFDFVSCCPPYEAVSYPEVIELLSESPLLHDNTILLVEYPKKVTGQVPSTMGNLVKLRDRRYGRTLVAVYGPESVLD